MSKIIFYEWQPGFNKIGFYRLLRTEFGYSLSTAKHAMESLMEGEIIEIEVLSPEIAERALHEAKQLGAIGKKVCVLQNKTEPSYQHWGQLENLLFQLLEKVLSQKLEQLPSFNNRELSQSATTPNLV